MTKQMTVNIPMGYVLAFTTDAVTTGTYTRLGNPGGTRYTPTDVAASTAYSVGPFNEPRDYVIAYEGSDFSTTMTYSGIFTSADDAAFAPLASPTFTGTVVLPSTTSVGDVSALELGYVNGVTSALQTQIDAKAPTAVTTNVGAVSAGTTAAEYGDGYQHTTVLTVNTTLPAIAGGADLAVGKLLYTFPAGSIVVKQAYMSLAITQTEAHITADTPEIGLGTVIASGAVAVLSGTATFEDILTGQVAADCDGTATVKTVADQVKVIESAGAKTVYCNVADGWAADGDAAATLVGTVVIHWQKMG